MICSRILGKDQAAGQSIGTRFSLNPPFRDLAIDGLGGRSRLRRTGLKERSHRFRQAKYRATSPGRQKRGHRDGRVHHHVQETLLPNP